MATEFDSLNSIVERQNEALLSQNDAVKNLALDVEKHESQILKLALQINHLQSLLPGVSIEEANVAVKEQQALMQNQQQLIRRQEKQLQSVNEQLEDKDAKIHMWFSDEDLRELRYSFTTTTEGPEMIVKDLVGDVIDAPPRDG